MALFSMRCYQTDFVEVVHLGLQFFIEYFLSLIFIVVTNLMLVSVWIWLRSEVDVSASAPSWFIGGQITFIAEIAQPYHTTLP